MHQITPATSADLPALSGLLSILFELEHDFVPDTVKQTAALEKILAQPETGSILVLRIEEKPVGMVSLLYTVSTACGGKVALLEDMIVHPDMRHDRRGSALLEAAIQHARLQGCLRITLLTDRVNDGAIRFYQRHQFTLSEMIPMRLMLEATQK